MKKKIVKEFEWNNKKVNIWRKILLDLKRLQETNKKFLKEEESKKEELIDKGIVWNCELRILKTKYEIKQIKKIINKYYLLREVKKKEREYERNRK